MVVRVGGDIVIWDMIIFIIIVLGDGLDFV